MKKVPAGTVDVNIEYSHIYYRYTDKLVTGEHEKSIALTKDALKALESRDKTYSLTVMIDTSMREHCSLDQIANLLAERGLKPDHVINESALTDAARDLVKNIPQSQLRKNKRGDVSFVVDTEDEYKVVQLIESSKETDYMTCPIVATTWQLFRLGKLGSIEFSNDDFKSFSEKPFTGLSTLTVIPKKFMRVESDVYDVISTIKRYRKTKDRIQYIFY